MVLPPRPGRLFVVLTILLAGAVPVALAAEDGAQREFERGYFLQTHQGDNAAAAAAFEKVVAEADAPAALRAEAKVRLDQCREDIVAADLARLMPPDAMVYAEITRPGTHLRQLLKMVGLVRDGGAPGAEPAAAGPSKGVSLGPGLFFPDDFTVSPALVEELEKFQGAAVALTSIDPEMRRPPAGVAVLHSGDFNYLRGELETGVQLLPPDEPIEGYKTYQVAGQAWVTVTSRLMILSNTRQGVADAVARLKDPNAESLANSEDFQRCQGDRGDAMVFAYASGPRLLKQFGPQLDSREAAIVRTVLDLDHLESVTAMAGTTQQSIVLKMSMNLTPGHRNLLLGLIQTAPLCRRSLDYVPGEAAAVVLLGLNPAGGPTLPASKEGTGPLTAMDLGREVFANIEEMAVFVMPPAGGERPGPPVPDFGLVIAVKDAARSEALWNQLLALPALFGIGGVSSPREVTIEGHSGKLYSFPEAPPLVVMRLGDRAFVAGTQAAVAAAAKAGASKSGLATDASFKPLLDRLGPTTSKAVLVDAGRVTQTAAGIAAKANQYAAERMQREMERMRKELEQQNGDEKDKARRLRQVEQIRQIAARVREHGRRELEMISMVGLLLRDLKITAISEEGPTKFAVRVEATGLPNAPQVIKTVVPIIVREIEGRMEAPVRDRAVQLPPEPTVERAVEGSSPSSD